MLYTWIASLVSSNINTFRVPAWISISSSKIEMITLASAPFHTHRHVEPPGDLQWRSYPWMRKNWNPKLRVQPWNPSISDASQGKALCLLARHFLGPLFLGRLQLWESHAALPATSSSPRQQADSAGFNCSVCKPQWVLRMTDWFLLPENKFKLMRP